jgi:hypothetical protein
MSEQAKLEVEILTGPLDGYIITLEIETELTRLTGGLLAFPWDDELGQPQCRFIFDGVKWLIEPNDSPHGTYILNRDIKLSEKIIVQKGDLLKASRTWMIIRNIL